MRPPIDGLKCLQENSSVAPAWHAGSDKTRRLFDIQEAKKEEDNTGLEMKRNASRLRSAEQNRAYLVSNGLMTPLMEL